MKGNRVGIITIHRINNYGAVEQAYALNFFLRQHGYDTETIDFRTNRVAESYKWLRPIKSIMDIARNLQSLAYYRKLKRRNWRFESFIQENIPLSKIVCRSNEELEKQPLKYDYFICGSDQIWNTFCDNYDDAFVLDFARDKGYRIAYAASLGHDAISEGLRPRFQRNLPYFKAISVREKSAVPVIESIANKEVYHVVDPVFLLTKDQWNQVSSTIRMKKPYIFCYYVKGDLPYMRQYARKLSKITKLPLVVVTKDLREMLYSNVKCYDAGPAEFISLVANAEYVCTNSFHACAFSIIFKRRFMIFTQKKSPRLHSILASLGLDSRLASCEVSIDDMVKEIDYDEVYDKLDPMIAESKKFLLSALDYTS